MARSFIDHERRPYLGPLAALAILLFSLPFISQGLTTARFERPAGMQLGDETSRTLLVTWSGSEIGDPRIAQLANQLLGTPGADGLLRGGTPLVASVSIPMKLYEALTAAGIPVDDAAAKLRGLWLGRGGLKIELTDAGRRDIPWTVRRIRETLACPEWTISLQPKTDSPASEGDVKGPAIPAFDLEVLCTSVDSPAISPKDLADRVAGVLGHATSDEPQGQRLVAKTFESIGSPVAVRVALSEAGTIEPEAAETAVRKAALAVGLPASDVVIVGKPLEIAEHCRNLRTAVTPTVGGIEALSSAPVALAAAGLLVIVLTGFAAETMIAVAMGAFGAGLTAAIVNALGIGWTDSLLLVPSMVFLLTVTFTLLAQPTTTVLKPVDASHPTVPKPVSLPVLLAVLAATCLMCCSQLNRPSERTFAVVGVFGIVGAWLLSAVVVPTLRPILPAVRAARMSSSMDFAAWATVHPRTVLASSLVMVFAGAAVILQPKAGQWVTLAAPHVDVASPEYRLEQTLGGAGDLAVTIRFSEESCQHMRFVERANVVREATSRMRGCSLVSGAVSLADFSEPVTPLAENARPKERAAYLRKSSAVEQQLKGQNESLRLSWLKEAGDAASPAETWTIVAAVRQVGQIDSAAASREIHLALQDVVRFHAGVTHSISGDIPQGTEAFVQRRPRVTVVLSVVALVAAAVATSNLPVGLIATLLTIGPAIALALLDGGVVRDPLELIGIAFPTAVALIANLWLLATMRREYATSGFHVDALARSLATTGRSSRALLSSVLLGMFVVSFQTAGPFGLAARLAVLSSIWAMTSTAMVMPLLLASRVGLWMAGAGVKPETTDDAMPQSVPVRIDAASGLPHAHLDAEVARRARHAS